MHHTRSKSQINWTAMLQVYLNPERELSDMPLKTFYRYVLPESSVAGQFATPPCYTSLLHLPATLLVMTVVLHCSIALSSCPCCTA